MRILSVVIFLAFVAAAFATNFSYFVAYIHLLLLIVLAHNTLAYLVECTLRAAFNLNLDARKTIALDTGIQD